MNKILLYVGMHFKLHFKKDKNTDKKSSVITFLMGVLVIAIGLFLSKYLFEIISKQFLKEITPSVFATILFSAIGIVLIVYGISLEIKLFLNAKDTSIVARLPMSSLSLFVANLMIVYIYLLAISVLVIVPIMIIFTHTAGVLSIGVAFGIILSGIFAPLVPFAIATILVVPTMYILVALQNKNITKLIIFLVILAGLFILYSLLLNFLAEYYIHKKVSIESKDEIIGVIESFNNGWNFFSYLSHIAFGERVITSMLIFVSSGVVLLGVGILIAVPVVDNIRKSQLESDRKTFTRKSKLTKDKPIEAILKKEFKEIIRTHTYAYFYLGIAIIMPIMVLLTNVIIQKVGKAQMGDSIAFGTSVLVVLAFVSMINSFSGSALSREGKEFYITKIVPVDFRTQLLAKGLLNMLVSLVAVVMSDIILCGMHFITIGESFVLLFTALLLSLGIIFNGFNINVRKPNIASGSASGSESQTNLMITMFIGLLLSAVEGFLAIFLSFFLDSGLYIYILLIAISCFYALINTLVFIFTANNKYFKIE